MNEELKNQSRKLVSASFICIFIFWGEVLISKYTYRSIIPLEVGNPMALYFFSISLVFYFLFKYISHLIDFGLDEIKLHASERTTRIMSPVIKRLAIEKMLSSSVFLDKKKNYSANQKENEARIELEERNDLSEIFDNVVKKKGGDGEFRFVHKEYHSYAGNSKNDDFSYANVPKEIMDRARIVRIRAHFSLSVIANYYIQVIVALIAISIAIANFSSINLAALKLDACAPNKELAQANQNNCSATNLLKGYSLDGESELPFYKWHISQAEGHP